MNQKMLKVVPVLTALVLGMISAAPARAADDAQSAKPAIVVDNMTLLRNKIRADKKLAVSVNMELTPEEAAAFWPVYEEYQKEAAKLWDRTLKAITSYADAYADLTDETAKKLTDEAVAIEKDRAALRLAYLPKFRKVLSDKKVARYYQIESKIQAVLAYDMAGQIPLVK